MRWSGRRRCSGGLLGLLALHHSRCCTFVRGSERQLAGSLLLGRADLSRAALHGGEVRCPAGSSPRAGLSRGLPARALPAKEPSVPDGEPGLPEKVGLVILLLLAAGPAALAFTWTTWWITSGAISLAILVGFAAAWPVFITLAVAGAFAVTAMVSMQFVGFSVLATSLAVVALLLKASIPLAAGWLLYSLAKGELPSFPARRAEATANTEPQDSPFADWDARFQLSSERLRFEELSPTSKFTELRAFIKQEDLDIKTGGRSKADVYKDIAVRLMKR